MEIRKIIHVDMDAFFASVEQRDNPSLQGKPVIVGGTPERRGVVAACSYEARKFGIHSAMSSARAIRLCPDAVFLRPRFEQYRDISIQTQAIYRQFTNLIEPMSLDEAYLDVSNSSLFAGSAVKLAREIKQQVKNETGLTVSAGVSYNKFLAKIASDMDKPDGLYVITPDQGEAFIEQLPIRKFHGIGKATEKKMKVLGINTGADLKKISKEQLLMSFGKAGTYFYNIARAIDNRPVNPVRKRKSMGAETTLMEDTDDINFLLEKMTQQAEKLIALMKEKSIVARTITIKIKYDNFEQITRSQSTIESFRNIEQIKPLLSELLTKTEAGKRKVRLLGVAMSNLSTEVETEEEQMDLI